MRLGLLGAGSIGGTVAKAVASGQLPGVEVVAVAGASTPPSERVERIAALVGAEALDVGGMIQKRPDWVLEAAGNHPLNVTLPGQLPSPRLADTDAPFGTGRPPLFESLPPHNREAGKLVQISGDGFGNTPRHPRVRWILRDVREGHHDHGLGGAGGQRLRPRRTGKGACGQPGHHTGHNCPRTAI